MGSPANIDVAALLAPVSEEASTGIEFDKADADSDYYRVKGLRDLAKKCEEDAQRALMLGDDADPFEPPDWNAVVAAATEVLRDASKDLRIACWLAEALIREYGFSGLRDGLSLCYQLCETYWDAIRPAPNSEEGHGETVAMFSAITGDAAIRYLRQLPVTGEVDGVRYSLADYATTSDVADGEEQAGPRSAQAISYSEFQQAVAAAGASYYRDLIDDQQESVDLLRKLTELFDEKCLPDEYDEPTSPSTTTLRQELEEAARIVGAFARPLLEGGEPTEVEPSDSHPEGQPGGQVSSPPGTVGSREEAFRSLQKVADYFERSEPHSPISYALRQVIGWGHMSLPELLKDLIGDETVRGELTRRVGVPLTEKEE